MSTDADAQPGQDSGVANVLAVLRAHRLDCRYDEADTLIDAELARSAGDPARMARLHVARGRLRLQQYAHGSALEEFAAALRHEPEYGPAAGWRVATLDRMGRLDEAMVEGTAALALLPESADLLVSLGRLHRGCALWEQACDVLRSATRADSRWDVAWTELGWALWDNGERQEAIRCLADAANRLPDSVRISCAAAKMHCLAGEKDEARRHLSVARALDSGSGRLLRAEIRFERHFGTVESALRAGGRASERQPRRPDLHAQRAVDLLDASDWDEAISACDEALRYEPRWADALRLKVRALRSRGDLHTATATGREAMELCPYSSRIRVETAWAELTQSREEQALALVDEALRIRPFSARSREARLSLLLRRSRYDQALVESENAVGVFPANADILAMRAAVFACFARNEEALEQLHRARALAPMDKEIFGQLLDVLESMQCWNTAMTTIAEARTTDRCGSWEGFLWERQAELLNGREFDREALVAAENALHAEPRRERARILRLLSLENLGRLHEAESAARSWIADMPSNPEPHVALARVLNAAHRTQEALDAAEQALAVHSWWSAAYAVRAQILRDARRWDEAEDALQAGGRHGGDPVWLMRERVQLLLSREDYPAALDAVEDLLRLEPDGKWALSVLCDVHEEREDWEAAKSAAARLIEVWPHSAFGDNRIGSALERQGRLTEAMEAFQRGLERDPASRGSLCSGISILGRLGRYDEAERWAQRALDIRPDDPTVLVWAAWLYWTMERPDRGRPYALRAAELTDDAWSGVEWLVALLRRSCEWDEAEQVLRKYLEAHPEEAEAHMAMAYLQADQDRFDDALLSVEQALACDPDRLRVLTYHVEILCTLHRWPEAEAAALKARRQHPGKPPAHVATAYVLAERHRHEDALPHLRRALQLDPEHEWACRLLIDTLVELGRFEEAERAAEALLGRAPRAVSVRCRLAYALREQRRLAESLTQCERAVADDPCSAAAHTQWATTLRASGSLDEAEGILEEFLGNRPHLSYARVALAYVHAERRDYGTALALLDEQRRSAPGPHKRADVLVATGWVALLDRRPLDAADSFDEAMRLRPTDHEARLGQAWALIRRAELGDAAREIDSRLTEAAAHCRAVSREDPRNAAAHTCLGLIAHRRGETAAAERHFARAVELDPYGRCHTDLGSLYVQLGRYEEAEAVLRRAVELDWYDAQAHVELGSLALHRAREGAGDGTTAQAAGEFRRAVAVDPDSGSAALGLAVALAEGAGDLGGAEEELRRVLGRPGVRDQPQWQLRLALARLLVQAGDAEQSADRYRDAGQEARAAIRLAEREAEPHFVAGVVEQRLGTQTVDVRLKLLHRRRAQHFLKRCRRLDPAHQDAERALRLLEEDARAARGSRLSSAVLVLVATAVLAAAWVDFLWKHHVTAVMLTTLTPVLAGLIAVGFLLPVLIRLKLPGGMEADLSASIGQISRGPRGEVVLTPARMPTGNGPVGRMPRL
ncbi:tetratricopeptide repeat protein [Streptomyces sp. NPDC001070]